MINGLEAYYDQGQRVAGASKNGDSTGWKFERDYYTRMLNLEANEDKRMVADVYTAGYHSVTGGGRS